MRQMVFLFSLLFSLSWASLDDDLSKAETALLFVGHPRSGHSIIGACLNAHPHMVIAHEYCLFDKNFSKNPFNTLKKLWYRANQRFPGRDYTLKIPGTWQGRYDQKMTVIGDKCAWTATRKLAESFDKQS